MHKEEMKKLVQCFFDEVKRTVLHVCGKPSCIHHWDGECHMKTIVICEDGKCLHSE